MILKLLSDLVKIFQNLSIAFVRMKRRDLAKRGDMDIRFYNKERRTVSILIFGR